MPTPSPKPFPYQHPHIPSRHMGRTVLVTPTQDIDLNVGHNNVIMNGMPIIRARDAQNQAHTVEGGINLTKIKKGILTFTQKKSDGTTASFTSGSATGGTGTFNIAAFTTSIFKIDGVSRTKNWFGGSALIASSGATYASLNTKTLIINVNGSGNQTVTFDNTCIDRSSTQTFIAAHTTGLQTAILNVTDLNYSTTKIGTGASLQIIGGTALSALGLTAGAPVNGSGDAADMSAVTRAEVVTALSSVLTGATVTDNGTNVVVTSNSTGSTSTVQLDAASTQTLGFDTNVHAGNGGPLTIEWSCEVFDPVPVT